MPQTSPMNWMLMSIMFSTSTLMTSSMMNKTMSPPNKISQTPKIYKKCNMWKW